jgi:hypothetical protein
VRRRYPARDPAAHVSDRSLCDVTREIIHIDRHVDRLFADAGLVELAVRHAGDWWRGGLFDDPVAFRQVVDEIGDEADVYTTFNQIRTSSADARHRRVHNKLMRGRGLKNEDITRRVRLVFDLDPVRAAGFDKYNASNREVMAAVHVAGRLRDDFTQKANWPEPAFVYSGNGAHVIFKADISVSLENDRLVRMLYAGIRTYFASSQVSFDTAVQNAARILRLPGTWNIGKLSSPDRPARAARVITPETWDRAVSIGDVIDLLHRYGMDVAYKRKISARRARASHVDGAGDYRSLDVVAWFGAHGSYKRPLGDSKHAVICPWHPEHSTPDAPDGSDSVVWESDGGWPTFHCSHAHCNGRTLVDVMATWGDADAFCAREFARGRFQCGG